MARWEGLDILGDHCPCTACRRVVGVQHWVADCPWRHLFRVALHTELHMRLDTLCTCWKRHTVTEWGVLVLYGPDVFALSVGTPADDSPHPAAGVRTIYLEPYGDGADDDRSYLYDRGLVVWAA